MSGLVTIDNYGGPEAAITDAIIDGASDDTKVDNPLELIEEIKQHNNDLDVVEGVIAKDKEAIETNPDSITNTTVEQRALMLTQLSKRYNVSNTYTVESSAHPVVNMIKTTEGFMDVLGKIKNTISEKMGKLKENMSNVIKNFKLKLTTHGRKYTKLLSEIEKLGNNPKLVNTKPIDLPITYGPLLVMEGISNPNGDAILKLVIDGMDKIEKPNYINQYIPIAESLTKYAIGVDIQELGNRDLTKLFDIFSSASFIVDMDKKLAPIVNKFGDDTAKENYKKMAYMPSISVKYDIIIADSIYLRDYKNIKDWTKAFNFDFKPAETIYIMDRSNLDIMSYKSTPASIKTLVDLANRVITHIDRVDEAEKSINVIMNKFFHAENVLHYTERPFKFPSEDMKSVALYKYRMIVDWFLSLYATMWTEWDYKCTLLDDAYKIAFESLARHNTAQTAMEDFDNMIEEEVENISGINPSTEGFIDTVKEAIKKMIAWIKEKIKKLVDWFRGKKAEAEVKEEIKKTEENIEDIKTTVEELKEKKVEESDVSKLLKMISYDYEPGEINKLKDSLKLDNSEIDTFLKKIRDADNDMLKRYREIRQTNLVNLLRAFDHPLLVKDVQKQPSEQYRKNKKVVITKDMFDSVVEITAKRMSIMMQNNGATVKYISETIEELAKYKSEGYFADDPTGDKKSKFINEFCGRVSDLIKSDSLYKEIAAVRDKVEMSYTDKNKRVEIIDFPDDVETVFGSGAVNGFGVRKPYERKRNGKVNKEYDLDTTGDFFIFDYYLEYETGEADYGYGCIELDIDESPYKIVNDYAGVFENIKNHTSILEEQIKKSIETLDKLGKNLEDIIKNNEIVPIVRGSLEGIILRTIHYIHLSYNRSSTPYFEGNFFTTYNIIGAVINTYKIMMRMLNDHLTPIK